MECFVHGSEREEDQGRSKLNKDDDWCVQTERERERETRTLQT